LIWAKLELRISKYETNSKHEGSNVQMGKTRGADGIDRGLWGLLNSWISDGDTG